MDDRTAVPRPVPGNAWRDALIVTVIVAVYVLIALRLQTHWWFEDDAYQIAYASKYRPWEFFVSREALARGLVGLLFTPLQNLSYWVDGWLAPRSPGFAYAHTAIAFWAGMLLWLAVLRPWIGRRAALVVTMLTPLLPATIVMVEFISLRNYLDGLVLALAGIWCAQRAISSHRGWMIPAVICSLLASLAKELYVTTPFALVALMFLWHRVWAGVALYIAAGLAYVGYYRWLIGSLTRTFDIPTLSLAEYPAYLLKFPYVFAGGAWGWLLAGVMCAAIGYGLYKRLVAFRDVGLVLLLIGISLASMHPAAGALDAAYDTRGTWYRVSFVSNLVILAGVAWLIRTLSRRWRQTVAVTAAVCLALGAVATIRTWDGLKAQYRLEGQFYLANPDKLIYSEVPAWWFLVGIDELYRVPERHYLFAARPGQPGDAALLARFGTVWRYSPVIGGYFPAPDVFKQLTGAP